jgi:hypothetical protein
MFSSYSVNIRTKRIPQESKLGHLYFKDFLLLIICVLILSSIRHSNICYWYLIHLVAVLIDDRDEPAGPVPTWHGHTVLEVACESRRISAGSGMPWQVNAFVIVQNLFAIG